MAGYDGYELYYSWRLLGEESSAVRKNKYELFRKQTLCIDKENCPYYGGIMDNISRLQLRDPNSSHGPATVNAFLNVKLYKKC